MDSDTTTTRKGFLKQAGGALLGGLALFGLSRGARSEGTASGPSVAGGELPRSAVRRIRPVPQAVSRSEHS